MRLACLSVCIALCLIGCRPSSATIEWKESVELASGEIVQIEREQKVALLYQDSRRPDRIPTRARLRITSSEESTEWSGEGIPVLVERQPSTRKWLVIEAIRTCDHWVEAGRPDPPYFAYEFDEAEWRRIKIPGFVIDQRYNVASCTQECPPEVLTPEYKKREPVVGDRTPYFYWVVPKLDETFCPTRQLRGAQ